MERNEIQRGVPSLLWTSFKTTAGPLVAAIGIAVSFIAWVFKPEYVVSLPWVVLGATIVLTVVTALMHGVVTASHAAGKRLPAIKMSAAAPPIYEDILAVLLLEKSDLIAQDSLVSIYRTLHSQYDVWVGIGRVLSLQDNGLIQIGVLRVFDEHADLLTALTSNDRNVLDQLKVKPNVPRTEFSNDFGDIS